MKTPARCWADGLETYIVAGAGGDGYEETRECQAAPDPRCGLGLCAAHCSGIHGPLVLVVDVSDGAVR